MSRKIPGPISTRQHESPANENENRNRHESNIDSAPLESWVRMQKLLQNECVTSATAVCKVLGVLEGNYDLIVPRIVVSVTFFTSSPDGSWLLELRDETGSIQGFISAKDVQSNKEVLSKNSTILLEKVSIFVSKSPFKRILNIHSNCIKAVFTSR